MSPYKYPPVIYLQRGPAEEITWCSEEINEDDVKYIRADQVNFLKKGTQPEPPVSLPSVSPPPPPPGLEGLHSSSIIYDDILGKKTGIELLPYQALFLRIAKIAAARKGKLKWYLNSRS